MFPLLTAIPSLIFGTVDSIRAGKAAKDASAAAGVVAGQQLFDANYNAAKAALDAQEQEERRKKAMPYIIAGIVILAAIIIYKVTKRK